MQALAAFLMLPAAIYGYVQAGLSGALTGFVAVVAVGSSVAISAAELGTGVAHSGSLATWQRLGGGLAAIAAIAGCYFGGWESGWAWGAGGYVLGIVITFCLALTRDDAREWK